MKYTVTATVEASSLGEAISAVTPHAIGPLAIVPVSETIVPLTASGKGSRGPRGATKLTMSQTRVGLIIMSALKTGPCTFHELADQLEAAGFSPNSVSGAVSAMDKKEGLVERYRSSLNGTMTTCARLRSDVARAV